MLRLVTSHGCPGAGLQELQALGWASRDCVGSCREGTNSEGGCGGCERQCFAYCPTAGAAAGRQQSLSIYRGHMPVHMYV